MIRNTLCRYRACASLRLCTGFLVATVLCMVPANAEAVDSMSNGVNTIQPLVSVGLLLVEVKTGIYHTIGINPTCERDKFVAFRLDAQTPVELMEQKLIRQALETARLGPLRIQFSIVQNECVEVPSGIKVPVATGVKLIQTK